MYKCYRLKIWDMEKMMWFVCSVSKHLVGMPADMQTDHGISSVHAQCFSHWKVEQMIMTSSNDVTMIAHAIGKEGIEEKCAWALGLLLSGFWELNILFNW